MPCSLQQHLIAAVGTTVIRKLLPRILDDAHLYPNKAYAILFLLDYLPRRSLVTSPMLQGVEF